MKIATKFILILIFISSCKVQKPRIETKIQDCYNTYYTKNGNNIKRTINKFENTLISNGLLKSNKGKDYFDLLKKVENNEIMELKFDFKELDSMISIQRKYNLEIYECQQAIFKSDKYDTITFNKLKKMTNSLVSSNKFSSPLYAKGLLSIITLKDIELDYYKLMTFRILHDYAFDLNYELPETVLEIENNQKENYKNPFRITLNEKNEIIVNGKIIAIEQLKGILKNYEQSEKENSAILFTSNRETLYKTYKEVIDIIDNSIMELRNEYSKSEFSKEYKNLDKENKSIIKQKYPKRIIENKIIE